MKTFLVCLTLFFKLCLGWSFLPLSLWSAELPHQGRVVVSGQTFEGKGSFWFALVNEQDELVWNHLGGGECLTATSGSNWRKPSIELTPLKPLSLEVGWTRGFWLNWVIGNDLTPISVGLI